MQKALAPGQRVRVFGEVREGHLGREIVHPQFKAIEAGAPLPGPAHARLPDHRGARAGNAAQGDGARARGRSGAYRRNAARLADREAPPVEVRRRGALPARAAAAPVLAHAARARRAHAPGLDAPEVRRAGRAAALAQGAPPGARGKARAGADRDRRAHRRAARAPAVQADARAGARLARDPVRPRAHDADAAAAAGRRRQRQDDRRRARGAAGDRVGAPGRVHGADRDPRRAALSQAAAVARGPAGRDRLAVGQPAGQAAQGGAGGDGERRRDARRRHARAVRGRACCCRGSGSRSSTSSTASASRSG